MQLYTALIAAFAALALAAPVEVPEEEVQGGSLGNPVRTLIDIPNLPPFTITRVYPVPPQLTPGPDPERTEIAVRDAVPITVVRTNIH